MREDGGPETLDELLLHYRAMAEEHRKLAHKEGVSPTIKNQASAFGRAYDSAADELIRVMRRQGLIQEESLG